MYEGSECVLAARTGLGVEAGIAVDVSNGPSTFDGGAVGVAIASFGVNAIGGSNTPSKPPIHSAQPGSIRSASAGIEMIG